MPALVATRMKRPVKTASPSLVCFSSCLVLDPGMRWCRTRSRDERVDGESL